MGGSESIIYLRHSSTHNFIQTDQLAINQPPTFFKASVFPLTLIQCAWQNPTHLSGLLSNNPSSSEPFLISLFNSRKQHVQPCVPWGPQNNIRRRRGTQKVSSSAAAISSLACGDNIQFKCLCTPAVKISQGCHSARQSTRSGDSCRNLSG